MSVKLYSMSRRPDTKTYYYFNGNNNSDGDSRMTHREMTKHREYRKLLNFLLRKRNGKRDI